MNDPAWFAQEGFRCRLEWGRRGARAAAERGDILVVVDVLSFSTAAVTAVARGGIVYPCANQDQAQTLAAQVGAEPAVRREHVPEKGRFSLSPPTFDAMEPGTRVALASPNGATCARFGSDVPHLFVGALVNARAVGEAVGEAVGKAAAHTTGTGSVTVIACGERWGGVPTDDGELRFALEDYLGAGAILSYIPGALPRSPEAQAAEAAFRAAQGNLTETVLACGSGIELSAKGYEGDVLHAARLNFFDAVPVMTQGAILSAAL